MPSELMSLFNMNPSERPKRAPKGQKPIAEPQEMEIDNGLLEPEFAPHFHAWKNTPSPETTTQLLTAVDPVIRSAMRTYTGSSQTSPTLRSKAKLIVLNSLPRYDLKQAKLRTYLMTNLQSMRRAAAEEGQIIGVPERVRLDQQRMRTAVADLTDKLGREPSDAELARKTGLSLKRLAHVRKAKPSLSEGQITVATDDQEGYPADAVAAGEPGRDTYLSFIYHDLSPIDQFILEHSVGLHGKKVLPKMEIARRLKLSAGAISQRAAKIQAIIDRHENMKIAVI